MVVAPLRDLGDDTVGRQQGDHPKDSRDGGIEGKYPIELLPRRHTSTVVLVANGRMDRWIDFDTHSLTRPDDKAGAFITIQTIMENNELGVL